MRLMYLESRVRYIIDCYAIVVMKADCVDIKTKVPFQYEAHVLKCNFCFDVNGRFVTTGMVTLYVLYYRFHDALY